MQKQRIRVKPDGTIDFQHEGNADLKDLSGVSQTSPPRLKSTIPPPVTPLRRKWTFLKASRRRLQRNALIFTLLVHLIGTFFLIQFIRDPIVEEDAIFIDWVELSERKRTLVKPKEIKALSVEPTAPREAFRKASTTVRVNAMPTESEAPPQLQPGLTENLAVGTTDNTLTRGQTETRVPRGLDDGVRLGGKSLRPGSKGSGFDTFRRGSAAGEGSTPTTVAHDLTTRVAEDELGAVLEGTARQPSGHIRIVRLKHGLSDWWQDPTAIPSFAKWLDENTQLQVDMTYAGGSLPLTDDRILNAPMVIMTGHDKDIAVGRNLNKEGPLATGLTRAERAQLRKYIIERGGMLFFDDCGFNGNFAALAQNELQRTFPEYPLRNIDHTHELYTVYYQLPRPPRGGDVFWGNLNKGDSGGYFPTESQFRFQKGITINRRLAVVFNRKDYLCSMETAEVGSRALLRMRRSDDVHRFMTNLLIYQMTYGGNTDRSGFKR